MIQVELKPYELMLASDVGRRRQIAALCSGRPDQHGYDGSGGWQVHIEGAAGEMAFCKATNRYFSGSVNTFWRESDVGKRIQIRTRSQSHYDLIVRANDKDSDFFVLVLGCSPIFKIIGWITGSEAKQQQWIRTHGDRPEAWFVPQAALCPDFNKLKDM